MRIGILGSGDVGLKLGDGLIELGHTVKIGTSRSEKNKKRLQYFIQKKNLRSLSQPQRSMK